MSQSIKMDALPPDHPLSSRPTIQTIEGEEGRIRKQDAVNYVIEALASGLFYLPVNLPEHLQKDGISVVFSGELKEPDLSEMWAGQPLVLTTITAK